MRADGRLMSRRLPLLGALLPMPLLLPGVLLPGVLLGSRPEMRVLAASLKLIVLSLFHDDRLSMEPCV